MPYLRTYRLFISHAWSHSGQYLQLVNLIKNQPHFNWCNHSVPKHNPLIDPGSPYGKITLARKLRAQIQGVHCVLIIAGMYSHYRYWIDKEIEIAQSYRKPIIIVRPWGQARIPVKLRVVAKDIVYWQGSSVVAKIRQHARWKSFV